MFEVKLVARQLLCLIGSFTRCCRSGFIRDAGKLPVIGQAHKNQGALVPEPLMQVQIPGIAYRRLEGVEPQADLLLVSRNGESAGAARAFLGIARQGALTS